MYKLVASPQTIHLLYFLIKELHIPKLTMFLMKS
jgi:hypothetical protein